MTTTVIGVRIDGTQAKRGAVQVRRALRGISDEGSRTISRLGGLKRALFNIRTAFAGLGIGLVSASLIKTAANLDRVNRGLKLATGSARGAADAMGFISDNVDRLGLNLEAAESGFVGLAAAARGTSLEGEQTREIFLGVSEAAAAMGLSAEQTQGALTAVEQIISKGKVSAEELRGQLGERLPGAFQVAARAAGVTTEQLDKLLSTGKLVASDFLPLFAKQLRDEFGGAAEEAVDSAQGALNGFANAVERLKRTIATSGALDPLLDGIRALTELISDPAFQNGVANALKGIGNAIRFAVENVDLLIIALKAIGAAAITGVFTRLIGSTFMFVGAMGGARKAAAAAAIGLTGFARASAGATAGMAALRTVGLTLGGPVGIIAGIATALVLLIAKMRSAKAETENFRQKLEDLGKTSTELASDQLKQDIEKTEAFLEAANERIEELKAKIAKGPPPAPRGGNSFLPGTTAGQLAFEGLARQLELAQADAKLAEVALARLKSQISGTGDSATETDPLIAALREKIQGLANAAGGSDGAVKALEAAEEQLENLRGGLEESVATFGMTEAAALAWRLENGDLADSIALLGDRGPATAAKLIELANRLAELETAADQAEANIDTLGQLFDSTRTPAERYAITLAQLDELYIRLQDSAAAFGMTQEEFEEMFRRLRAEAKETLDSQEQTFDAMQEFATAAARSMQSAFSDLFFSVMQGEFDDLATNFKRTIDRMVADFLASQLLNLFAGQAGKGGLLGAIGTVVAGGKAQGGMMQGGITQLVGEEGPELFTAPANGQIIPNRTMNRLAGSQNIISGRAPMDRSPLQQNGQVFRGMLGGIQETFEGNERYGAGHMQRFPGRAQGGRVMRGQPVIAGEVGGEGFSSGGGGSGGDTINVAMTVNAADADSFRQSQGQILAEFGRLIQGARLRNG